jgi:hypothetical protein
MPVEIKDFAEALAQREGRELMPTGMSAEQLREVETAVRERSVFSARVMNAEFLERVRVITEQIVAGNLGENKARLLLGQYLDSIEYHARPGTEGTIQDLRTDARLNLIVRTQVNMAYGYGKWRGRQVQSVLDEYPCLEFYRAFDRKEPRDWPARWLEAGGQFYEGDSDYPQGRMIAPQNDLIWTAISAFGTPYAPFDYNSGMDTELVTRTEAIALGAWTENDRVYPAQRGFETDAGASVRDLSPEMAEALEESLGDGYSVDGGVIQANELYELLANSFEGHEGRPGERGGSLPRGGFNTGDLSTVEVVRQAIGIVGKDRLKELASKNQSEGLKEPELAMEAAARRIVYDARKANASQNQTETPEFKAWFGDSKVVDKDGKPLVVYHGSTDANFTSFDPDKGRLGLRGIYFTENPEWASSYTMGKKTGAVIPAYLSLKNPKIIGEKDFDAFNVNGKVVDEMKAQGYDGIIQRKEVGNSKFGSQFIAFHPTQIKSAIGNKGTWSKTDPSIVNELPDCVLQIANEMGIRQLENSMVIEEVFA